MHVTPGAAPTTAAAAAQRARDLLTTTLSAALYDAITALGDDVATVHTLLSCGADPTVFRVTVHVPATGDRGRGEVARRSTNGNTCLHAAVASSETKAEKAKAVLGYVEGMRDTGAALAFLTRGNHAGLDAEQLAWQCPCPSRAVATSIRDLVRAANGGEAVGW